MLFFGKKAVTLHRDLKTTLITYNNIMYTYKYPHPAVTTDCVVFGFDGNSLSLLLIKRGIEPYKGTWALPGGFICGAWNSTFKVTSRIDVTIMMKNKKANTKSGNEEVFNSGISRPPALLNFPIITSSLHSF